MSISIQGAVRGRLRKDGGHAERPGVRAARVAAGLCMLGDGRRLSPLSERVCHPCLLENRKRNNKRNIANGQGRMLAGAPLPRKQRAKVEDGLRRLRNRVALSPATMEERLAGERFAERVTRNNLRGTGRPPCFFFGQCGHLGVFEKGGKVVCFSCTGRVQGRVFPLRSPGRDRFRQAPEKLAENLGMV